MSPVLVNPYLSFGTTDPNEIDVWEELDRSSTITSGAITISGLDLTDYVAIRVLLLGLTVTTDDSLVQVRFLVAGSEVSTGYRWAVRRLEPAGGNSVGSTSDTSIHLTEAAGGTQAVGNASTESLGGSLTVFGPTAALFKLYRGQATFIQPDASASEADLAGMLEDTGAITGIKVFGSSDLTGGTVVVLGLD
jgi:hypothetical protein